MKNILVVYFSRSGYTRCMAEYIAQSTSADCEAIQESAPRRGLLGYWRSAREALRGRAAAIEPATRDPRDYALVVLGSPVWAGHLSSPMRAYLSSHRGELRRVALFCTQGGRGGDQVLQEMMDLCACPTVATMSLTDVEIDGAQYLARAVRFCAALRTADAVRYASPAQARTLADLDRGLARSLPVTH